MKPAGKKAWVAAFLVLVTFGLLWVFSGEPYYRGRPVSQWAIDYSRKLYPTGTAPLSPSQKGLNALREMGPEKAAAALVHALMHRDSPLYERYRALYPRLPAWYRSRFSLGLTYQQRTTLILGATGFFDADYQKALIPHLVAYLQKPDILAQLAACQLLANLPQTASPALPALARLTGSVDLSVAQAAQAAVNRINH